MKVEIVHHGWGIPPAPKFLGVLGLLQTTNNDCRSRLVLRTSRDRLLLLLLIPLPFSLSRSTILENHNMNIAKMSMFIRCDVCSLFHHYKVVPEAVEPTPAMKI